MKKVLTPKFKELFKYQSSLNELWDFEKEFSIYNPFTASFMLSALLLFLGFFNRHALFMGFALAIGLMAIYFILKNQSKRIYLKRNVPSRSTEYKEVKAKINIRNNSPFPIFDYSLIDTYTGSQVGNKTIKSSGSIAPYKSKRLLQKWENDGGMGEKYFESLIIEIRDPLEMICFPILEDKIDAISIYPHHERTPPIPVEFNISSAHYGEIDIPKRGESINFMGIRDYRKGDPVKRINWKQTAKQKKPIINLFERNIN